MIDDLKGISVILICQPSGDFVLVREHGDGRWWNLWRKKPVRRFASAQEAEAELRRYPFFFEYGLWWIIDL